jgi:hypothetical protein
MEYEKLSSPVQSTFSRGIIFNPSSSIGICPGPTIKYDTPVVLIRCSNATFELRIESGKTITPNLTKP